MNWSKIINIVEKGHYPFKRYPKKRCETVFFPGCALPSQFPKTMDRIAEACQEKGVGVAYDCCGMPLFEYGMFVRAVKIINGIKRRLGKCGCKRVAFACPNCMYYLKDKLDCEVVTLYQLLDELEAGREAVFEPGMLYVPCPDRKERIIEESLRESYDLSRLETCTRGCCGLRPDIALKGSEVSAKCGKSVLKAAGGRRVFTYCASCAGQFKRLGQEGVRHVASVIVGVDEEPDAAHAFANRAKRKFARRSSGSAG